MTRGLVIGKFMPVHNGHIALINFAAAQCDELIVSMSFTDEDAINHELRFKWLLEIFATNPKIKLHIIKDDFDNENLPLHERTKRWAKKMKEYYPKIHVIFSSENYGQPFAENLGAKHTGFDSARKLIPVSATLIRNKPFTYWDYIPKTVQPFFVKKICFYGPESTGKTYMSKLMSAQFETDWVSEAARDVLQSNVFTENDIIKIAETHDASIFFKMKAAKKLLFCDTDVLTTQIYSQHYLGIIPQTLFEIEKKTVYDLYFLMNIDTPWIEDPLRDLQNKRDEMMNIFRNELEKRNIHYILIEGNYKAREEKVIAEINALLQKF